MDNTNNGAVDMLDEGMLSKAALAAGALAAKPVTKTVKRAAKAVNTKVGEASDKAKTAIGNVATGGNYGKVKEHTKGYNDDTAFAASQDANSKYYQTRSAEERKAADASREKVKKLEAAKKQYEAAHHTAPAPKPKSLLGVIKTAIGTDNSNRRKIASLQSDIKKTTAEADTHSKKSTQLIDASAKAKEDAARLRNRAEQHRVANNAAVAAGKKQLMLRSSGAGALAGAAIGGIKGAMDVKKLKDSGADEEAIRQAKKDAVKKAAIGAGAGLAIGAGGGYAGASKFGKKHTISEAAMVAAIRTLQESLTSEEYAAIMDEAASLIESGITDNNADAIKFIASKHLDEASYAIVEAVMDESTKAGTVGAHMAKGAMNGAIKCGVTAAIANATPLNRDVRKAQEDLDDAEYTGNTKKIEAAKKKLVKARLAGAKKGAISGAIVGGALGAGGGAMTGAEYYKKTHTGPYGEEIIDVKNYADKKKSTTKIANEDAGVMSIIWGSDDQNGG